MGQAGHDLRPGVDEEPRVALRADAQQVVGPLDVRLMDRELVMTIRASHRRQMIGIGLQPDELQGEMDATASA